MARLPNRRRIMREDLKEAPSWIERLIGFINPFFEDIYYALNKQITHRENIDCDIRIIDFETSATYDSGVPDIGPIQEQIDEIEIEIDEIQEEIEEINETIDSLTGVPIGTILLWASDTSLPIGFLRCEGQEVSETEYDQLFEIIGTKYNKGDEAHGNFRLPNYKGLVPRGVGTQVVNGNSKNGGNLADILEDQIENHWHMQEYNASNDGTIETRNGATPVAATNRRWAFRDTGGSSGYAPKTSDLSVSGGARYGLETRASSISQYFIIRAQNLSTSSATQDAIDALNARVSIVESDILALNTKFSVRFVVAKYSSGNDWYEVYNDGWVRQGQFYHQAGATTYSRTFLVPMDGSRYSLKTSPHMNSSSQIQYRSFGYSFASSGFSAYTGTSTDFISWQLEGWGDSSAVTALGATPSY